jgi:hypothetical protein
MTDEMFCMHDLAPDTCSLCKPGASHLREKTSDCSTCGATILWVHTQKKKLMPLDAEPSPTGAFRKAGLDVDGTPMVAFVKPDDRPRASVPLFTSHFVTCPDRDLHRRS